MNKVVNQLKRMTICVPLLTAVMQVAAAETLDKTLAVDPRGEVEISNVSGAVVVSGWDRSEVQVIAELDDDVERLEFKREGERTLIKVIMPSGRVREGNTDADLTIRIPKDSRLLIRTVSADQIVENVRGAQRLHVVSGDIHAQALGSDFRAESVSGEIIVKGGSGREQVRTGRVRVNSVSGEVSVDNIGDDVEVTTVSGDMSIRATTLTRARVATTNGNLLLSSGLARDAQIEAEAINGELSLNIEGVIDAEFDIETFNGRIDNCFGPKSKRTHEYHPGSELRFKEGQGTASVRIKTLNGRVSLCRKQKSALRWIEPRLYAGPNEDDRDRSLTQSRREGRKQSSGCVIPA
jgi:DUF4097 and DUF4098 domain-containing protein YvlB